MLYENRKLTIFTPTFNREKYIKRVFLSLNAQTSKNFIWMIVDDGSVDSTKQIVKSLIQISKFPIEYFYQDNSGKHIAYNSAISNCHSDYFMVLDSDDVLHNNAVAKINSLMEKIENKDDIVGIIGNRFDYNTHQVIGKAMPNIAFASGNELYQKYGLKGDTVRVYKTALIKEYLFPRFDNEVFISENVIYDLIDKKYKMMVTNEELYYGEYLEEGASNNIYKIHMKNPLGYELSLRSSAESAVTITKKINYTILYMLWCKRIGLQNRLSGNNKALSVILQPIAYIFDKVHFPRFFYLHFNDKG